MSKCIRLVSAIGSLLIFSLACSLGSSANGSNTNPPPGVQQPAGTPLLATQASTLPPIAPTTNATQAPLIGVATTTPVTGTNLITVTPTSEATSAATAEATGAPQSTQPPPPPPPSSGPLNFTVDVTGCRVDPSREGGVILTMRYNPTGGNGVYKYYDNDTEKTRIFDRPATKGSGVIDSFRVDSSDGQSTGNIKLQFKVNDYCH